MSHKSNTRSEKEENKNQKANQLLIIKDPVKILPTVKLMIPNSLKKDHLF